jgi:hypothetical protein
MTWNSSLSERPERQRPRRLADWLNPTGERKVHSLVDKVYQRKSKLFHRLDGWIVRRLWSHRFRRWRNRGWKLLPERRLYGEYGLVKLVALIPSLNLRQDSSVKAVYGDATWQGRVIEWVRIPPR